MAQFMNSS